LIAVVAAALATGCSQILGFKDPRLDDTIAPGIDAPVDTSADAPVDTTPGTCIPAACPFGCDTTTNACRHGKLWIFKTAGATIGNGFGGVDVPPNVRGGADGRCLATYTSRYATRQCNPNNVHAILYVSSSDSIALMATMYEIPTNVGVHRADDAVLVSNNWNDLTDPTMALRAPATTAMTDAAGTIWTGTNATSTCRNWTSAVSSDTGTYGYTTRTTVTWLTENVLACDSVAGLLCICWSGEDRSAR
jgi:hypothetical protein